MYLSLIYILKDLEETLVHLLTLVVLGLRCCARFRLAAASAGLRFGSRVRFPRCSGVSSRGAQTLGRRSFGSGSNGLSRVVPGLWSTGSVVVAQELSFSETSSRTRDRTRVSCIERWAAHHWATREAPVLFVITFPVSSLPPRDPRL